jgi:chromosome segregation ATPase
MNLEKQQKGAEVPEDSKDDTNILVKSYQTMSSFINENKNQLFITNGLRKIIQEAHGMSTIILSTKEGKEEDVLTKQIKIYTDALFEWIANQEKKHHKTFAVTKGSYKNLGEIKKLVSDFKAIHETIESNKSKFTKWLDFLLTAIGLILSILEECLNYSLKELEKEKKSIEIKLNEVTELCNSSQETIDKKIKLLSIKTKEIKEELKSYEKKWFAWFRYFEEIKRLKEELKKNNSINNQLSKTLKENETQRLHYTKQLNELTTKITEINVKLQNIKTSKALVSLSKGITQKSAHSAVSAMNDLLNSLDIVNPNKKEIDATLSTLKHTQLIIVNIYQFNEKLDTLSVVNNLASILESTHQNLKNFDEFILKKQ